ncbi:aldehyde dehydrogenase family protein, partial [Vibrio anguillarum]|uniref:aldehyde dehydrogenase family protein n=1 Tax=Vibrio anguillarum TaxID=55601 RepID=UPI0018C26C3B
METVLNFINGQRKTSQSERFSAIYNPATGEQTRQVQLSQKEDVIEAINAAETAFASWAKTSPLKRARVMFRFKALLEQNMVRLARIISIEHGKIYSDAVGEVTRG